MFYHDASGFDVLFYALGFWCLFCDFDDMRKVGSQLQQSWSEYNIAARDGYRVYCSCYNLLI